MEILFWWLIQLVDHAHEFIRSSAFSPDLQLTTQVNMTTWLHLPTATLANTCIYPPETHRNMPGVEERSSEEVKIPT